MKKNRLFFNFISRDWSFDLLKFLRIMKITCFLLLISALSVFAGKTYSQTKMLNLNLENVSVKAVLSSIEDQSEFYFFFSDKIIDVNRKVTINAEEQNIETVLKSLFAGTDVIYVVKDRVIVLTTPEVSQAESQQAGKTISGKVTDSSGASLPGVSVVVKGTTTGIITDSEGNYSLSNIPENSTLQFSFIGMEPQEITIGTLTQINVTMAESVTGIDEVVVIGYGIQKRVNLTGSVSTVSSNSLANRPTTNATNLLQGMVSGLRVMIPTAQPGKDDASFEVRGLGSFGASSQPLVLIDGLVGSLSNLAPNDIESVTVLKDAASASIYGAKAANGVILVTTKQAAKGFSIEYQLDMGVHNATRLPKVITNSAEYMEMYNSARARNGQVPLYPQKDIDAYKYATDLEEYPNFDWIDYYFNPAKSINHYLSFSNKSDKSSYKFSLNYLDQDGIIPKIGQKKYNAQLNFTNQLSKAIKIGTNISAVFKDIQEPSNFRADDAIRYIYGFGPMYKPFLPDGSGRKTSWAYPYELHNTEAPVAFNGEGLTKNYALNAQVFMDIQLLKGLVWTVKSGINYSDNMKKNHSYKTQENYYYHKQPGQTDYTLTSTVVGYGAMGVTDNYNKSILPSMYSVLNYETKIGKDHNFTALLGLEKQTYKYSYLEGNKKTFPTNDLMELDAGASDGQTVKGSAYEWALMSYFGRIGYNFKGKYIIEANARYDGTSRVAEANRWGLFPSVSAGWRISEEKLIKDKFSWIDNLKLRASYGVLGNQEIGNYPYQDILAVTSYPSGGSLEQGVGVTRLADKNLRWESTKMLDFGLDMDIKNGLFGMTLDWYKKNTFDILAKLPVPLSIGLLGPTTNDGELQNIGWDIELRHRKQIGEFTYNVNFILSTYKNKLLSIVAPTKGSREVGLPYDCYYLYEMEGIFQSQADIDASANHIFYKPKPGDIKIKDQNGDKVINPDDRISISPFPDFTYSFGLNISWRRFSLSTFFQGVEGQRTRIFAWGYDPFVEGSPPSIRFRDAWSPTNPSNTEPGVYIGGGSFTGGYPGNNAYPSTYHLPDASYLRLKNVNLSYSLPKQIIDKIKLRDLTVFVSGDNLLTFTKFPEIDPEIATSSSRASRYPMVRILNAGVKIKF